MGEIAGCISWVEQGLKGVVPKNTSVREQGRPPVVAVTHTTECDNLPPKERANMQDSSMQRQWQSSHIGGANAAYVDELYESYLTDPNSVPEDWRVYFEKLPSVHTSVESDVPHPAVP